MSNWTLSVDLRGQGTDLARTLRQNAGHARTLGAAVRSTQRDIRSLGTTSRTAAGHVRALGQATDTTRSALLRLDAQAARTERRLRSLGAQARTLRTQLAQLQSDIRIAVRLDDETGPGAAAVRSTLDALRAESAGIAVRLDDDTATTAAAVRTTLDDLRASATSIAVRLDDETAPGATAIRAALDQLRAESATISVRLDDDTSTATTAVRASLAALRAESPVNLTVDVRLRNAAAAERALRQIQDAAQDAFRRLAVLERRALRTANALNELRTAARGAAGELRRLDRAADGANGRLGDLSTSTRTLRSDMDDLDGSLTQVTGRMGDLRGGLGSVSSAQAGTSRSTKGLILGAVALATALIPIAAQVGPLATGFVAAAAGAGALGVAIGGQIKHIADAAEAEKKYQEAVEKHGKTSEQAAEAERAMLRQMAQIPEPTRRATAAFQNFKDEYVDWSDSLAGDTMPIAENTFTILTDFFPHLTPMVRGSSREVQRFQAIVAGGMQTDRFEDFMDRAAEFSTETLARLNSGMVRLTTGMDTGEVGGDIREFFDFAEQHGPLVGETLSEIARMAMHLLTAAADTGVGVLTLVNALASLINAIPTDVLSTMLQLYTVMKLVGLGAAALAAVTGPAAAGRLAAYFAVMRAAGVAPTLRATAGSMSAVTKASIGLGVLAVAAIGISKLADKARGAPPDVDRLTTSLKNLAETGKFTGELADTFGDIDGVIEKLEKLGQATKDQQKYVDSFQGSGMVGALDDLRAGANDLWQDLTRGEQSITALKDDFKGLDEALAGMAKSGYGEQAAEDYALIQSAARGAGVSTKELAQAFPQYQAALEATAAEQRLVASGMGLFGEQALATKAKLDSQKASADGLRGAIQALNDVNRAGLGGMIAFEQAIDDAAKAAKDNAGQLQMTEGRLDLNSEKARKAATGLQDLATATDEAAAAAREANAPWSEIQAIHDRGRKAFLEAAAAMGLEAQEAEALRQRLLDLPDERSTRVTMQTEDAVAGLESVIAKLKVTPSGKSITVTALTQGAKEMLNDLGYTTKTLPDGRVMVTAKTGQAIDGLAAVRAARDALQDKTITITTRRVVTQQYITETSGETRRRDKLPAGHYADGGIVHAANGLLVPGYAPRQDTVLSLLSPGEGVLVPETVRKLGAASGMGSHGVIKALNAWGRYGTDMTAFADGGIAAPQRFADGGISTSYDPTELYTLSGIASSSRDDKGKFSPAMFGRRLTSSLRVARAWRKDLATVAARAGQDVADALEAMGEDGVELTRKMANGSAKYTRQMAASLKALADVSKATLGDYTGQLTKTVKDQTAFQNNLLKLAAQGNTDLAKALAEQGDQAAADLAAAAVKDPRRARHANTAARQAANALSPDQVEQLVAIIGAIATSKTGIHDVAATTGLGEDDIIAVATKASTRIKSALGPRASRFLADLARASKGLSYADGGIREGIYSTVGGAVTFAEPQTGGEAFIPLGANKRRAATKVLADVAGRFGLGLTDIQASRQVVVVKEGGDTYVTVPAVRTGATAADIGAQVGRQVRRASRGGVAARGK
ncbi:hypothetical protein [Streptomyces sp. DH12]|uniref:hypothetical protein n=1 Tax=Streptomyces sp. DH12 TaxID=2857010 RepID=UPI001E2A9440|nr:hypothetical protein [Streptomyces sp. DH12]